MPKTRSVPLAQHVWYRFAESVPHSREVELAPRRGTLTAVEPELRGVGWIVFLAGFFVGMTPVRCRCGASASTTTTSRPPPPPTPKPKPKPKRSSPSSTSRQGTKTAQLGPRPRDGADYRTYPA